jgi:hypothetical protein
VQQLKGDVREMQEEVQEAGRQIKEVRADLQELAAKKVDRDEVESVVERVIARGGAP